MLHYPGYGSPFRRRRGRGILTHAMMTVIGAALREMPGTPDAGS